MTRMNGFLGKTVGAAAIMGAFVASVDIASAAGPFAAFDGNWTGTGTITTTSGSKERLRCKGHYDIGGGGMTLSQNLTCASDSYKFNVVANVEADGRRISGTWEETTRNASGHIAGSIGPTQISANVSGLGFTAGIGIAARNGRQSVTISPTGTDIANVMVTMSKV